MKTKVWYSVENLGDGSAYPAFFDTKELAEWHQDHLDEGWGEPCVGFIELESSSEIFCECSKNAIQYLLQLINDKYNDRDEKNILNFIEKFLPNGLPVLIFICGSSEYYHVLDSNGNVLYQQFAWNHEENKAETTQKGLEEYKNSVMNYFTK